MFWGQPRQSFTRADPNIALAIFEYRVDEIEWKAVAIGDIEKFAIAKALYAAIGACPDIALNIFPEGSDETSGEIFFE
jgi:hypothetical protein